MELDSIEGAKASATIESRSDSASLDGDHCHHDGDHHHGDHHHGDHHHGDHHHDDHHHGDESDYLRIPQNSRSPLPSTSSEEDYDKPSLFVTPSTTGEVSAAPSRGHTKTLIIRPPSKATGGEMLPQLSGGVSPTSGQPLSLDLSLESITRYQAKPDSMYTFLCAQVRYQKVPVVGRLDTPLNFLGACH